MESWLPLKHHFLKNSDFLPSFYFIYREKKMKVFKTIAWTSLFWILVLWWIWAASFREVRVASAIESIVPNTVWQNIYNQGLQQGNENGKADCDCPECSIATGENETSVSNEILSKIPTTCKTFYDGCNTCNRWVDGTISCTLMECENYWEPKCLDNGTTTWAVGNQLFPAKTTHAQSTSNDELAALKNKVAELEKEHWALVQELQAIFSTPEAQKLLPTAPSTTR